MEFHYPPIFVLFVAAALAPIVAAAMQRFGLSVVVVELLLGIAVGPQGLALVSPTDGVISALATLGMACLFFIAGLEIDLPAIRGRPLNLAFFAWLGGFAVALAVALGLRACGLAQAWIVVAIALTTTALGVLVPILRDADASETPLGLNVMATGMMGEIGPIVAMSLALSRTHTADVQTGLTLAFVAAVLVLASLLVRGAKVPAILGPLRRGFDQSGQLPIRVAILLVVTLAVLAENFGLDLALGALAAGMMTTLAIQGGEREHDLHERVDAIGFGFLVPMFFLSSGMKLDVRSVFAGGGGFLLLAVFFVALLAVRVPLFLLLRGQLGDRAAAAVTLFSATTLSLVVVVTQIAVEIGAMPAAEAAPIVGAGILSVLLLPPLALRLAGLTRGSGTHAAGRDGL